MPSAFYMHPLSTNRMPLRCRHPAGRTPRRPHHAAPANPNRRTVQSMLRSFIKKRMRQRLVTAFAAITFLCASLQIAAPLHASHCVAHRIHHNPNHGCTSFDVPAHDAEHCPICHFLFGPAGKTVLPKFACQLCSDVICLSDTVGRQDILIKLSVHCIIPRAPPFAC